MDENLNSLFLRVNFQQIIPGLKNEKKEQGKNRIFVDFFAMLTTDSPLQNVSAFFLEMTISANMDDLKQRECILTLQQVKIRRFLRQNAHTWVKEKLETHF